MSLQVNIDATALRDYADNAANTAKSEAIAAAATDATAKANAALSSAEDYTDTEVSAEAARAIAVEATKQTRTDLLDDHDSRGMDGHVFPVFDPGGNVHEKYTGVQLRSYLRANLSINDALASHVAFVQVNEVLTSDRWLKFKLNNADRELTLSGDADVRGTNTGDQDLTPYATKTYADDAARVAKEDANSYADSLVVSVFRPAGDWDAHTGTWPTSGTGSGGGIRRGDTWNVTAAGTIGSKVFDIGDTFYANQPTPGQVDANWSRFETNTEQATESTRGTAALAAQSEVEDSSTTNDTKIVTPRKFWQGWTKGLTLSNFFSAVRGVTLTGLDTTTNATITSSDTVLGAFGKLQKQITDAASALAGNVRSVLLTGLDFSSGAAITATDSVLSAFGKVQRQITDAASNLAGNVRSVVLTGLDLSSDTAITAADTVLSAFGKLQAQVTARISIPGSSAQGDILIRDGSGWTRLAAGTSGQVLETGGASANPSWQWRPSIYVFHHTATTPVTWTSMPSALTALNAQISRSVAKIDLTRAKQVRLVVMIAGTAGSAGSKLIAKYRSTYDATIGNYSDIGTSEVSAAINSTGTMSDSGWIDIAPGAQGDMIVAIAGSGGNGSTSPVIASVAFHWR